MMQTQIKSPWRELELQPISLVANSRWSSPKDFRFVELIPEIPIADSELLQLSHHLPIVLAFSSGRPMVVALTDPTFLRSKKIGTTGRWLPTYVPIVLRGLPFWPMPAENSSGPQVATALGLVGTHGQISFRTPQGLPSRQTETVLRTLMNVHEGMERLKEAAKVLMIADVLVRLEHAEQDGSPVDTSYYVVDESRFLTRTGLSLSAAIHRNFLPFDIAAACLFSRRHLSAAVTWRSIDHSRTVSGASNELEAMLRARDPIPFSLDDSETFDVGTLFHK